MIISKKKKKNKQKNFFISVLKGKISPDIALQCSITRIKDAFSTDSLNDNANSPLNPYLRSTVLNIAIFSSYSPDRGPALDYAIPFRPDRDDYRGRYPPGIDRDYHSPPYFPERKYSGDYFARDISYRSPPHKPEQGLSSPTIDVVGDSPPSRRGLMGFPFFQR